jgi:hypothetical protein
MDYARPVPREEARRISLTTGVLFIVTFITSIPALYLFQPVLDDPAATSPAAARTTGSFWARSSSCS